MRFKYYLRGAGIGVIVATLVLSIAFLFHDNISDEEVIRRAMKLGMIMQENAGGTLANPSAPGDSSADVENDADGSDGTGADQDPLTDPDDVDGDTDGNAGDDGSDRPDGNADGDGDDSVDVASGENGDDNADRTPDDASGNGDSNANGTSGSNANDAAGSSGSDKKPSDNEAGNPDKKPSDSGKGDSADKPSDKNEADEVEIVIASGDVSRMVSAKVFEAGLVDNADEFNSYLGDHDYDNMLQPGTYKIKKGSSFRQIARILTRQ